MKKILCIALVLCVCVSLFACAKPTDKELRQELTNLMAQAAGNQLKAADYYRVTIDTLEADGKNRWIATGNVNYSDSSTSTVAVLYTATLRYNKSTKSYSVEATFGETFYI